MHPVSDADLEGSRRTSGPATTTRPAAVAEDTAGAPSLTAGTDYSATNVQEAGVDEPDVVKTDGDRILAVAGGRLHYVDVTGTPRKRGSLALDGQNGGRIELLLYGDRALVIRELYPTVEGPGPMPLPMPLPAETTTIAIDDSSRGAAFTSAATEVSVVSLADPDSLEVTDSFTIDGSYQSARLVEGTARVVVTSEPRGLDFVYPQGPGGEDDAEATNRSVIDRSTIDQWLPQLRHGNEAPSPVDCAQVFTPRQFAGIGMVDVVTVAVEGELAPTTVSLAGSGATTYASATSLYVAAPAWVDVPKSPTAGDIAVAPVPLTTDIHRFDISGKDDAAYVASGRIPGSVLNQFSMSEHDDRLRVATTEGGNGGDESQSYVRVLAAQGSELVEVGAVGNMGRGEQIHSVRFQGTVGYVVTFRQVDPFYVLDLSDPTKPRVVGELKIPGYSGYLHPLGDGLVLGVGQDATGEGRRIGAKVSLFDVSDPARPAERAVWSVPGGESGAEWDHHAFLYWPASKLAVLPLSTYQPTDGSQFTGAVGLDVAADAITERGRIEHPATSGPVTPCSDVPAPDDPAAEDVCILPPPFGANIERSMVIGATVWTFSSAGLLGSDLTTLAPGPWIPLS
ncbi:MAG: beta-propeller domain-containing protein [Acidimicrobiales bacterium]